MEFKDDNCLERAPQWLEVDDKVMEDRMSEDEKDWRVQDWLDWSVQLQDSMSMRDQVVGTDRGEPMLCANHSASDQPAHERMWRHAQKQSNRDGQPRIQLHPNVT